MRQNPASHNIPAKDLYFYAQSFHKSAKKLAAAFQVGDSLFPEADASAVVFVYRHAVELFLKAIVLGEGGKFLVSKPDPISVGKTHSLSWLAQIVRKIITAVKWEAEFTCEGVHNFAEFKVIMEDINSADPGSYVFRLPATIETQGPSGVQEFARQTDALLDLLDSTADALAAEWELRMDSTETDEDGDGGFGPTIQ
jgi:hypothetical protein